MRKTVWDACVLFVFVSMLFHALGGKPFTNPSGPACLAPATRADESAAFDALFERLVPVRNLIHDIPNKFTVGYFELLAAPSLQKIKVAPEELEVYAEWHKEAALLMAQMKQYFQRIPRIAKNAPQTWTPKRKNRRLVFMRGALLRAGNPEWEAEILSRTEALAAKLGAELEEKREILAQDPSKKKYMETALAGLRQVVPMWAELCGRVRQLAGSSLVAGARSNGAAFEKTARRLAAQKGDKGRAAGLSPLALLSYPNVPLDRLKVIVVDDEELIRILLPGVLVSAGISLENIRLAKEGEEGWRLWQEEPAHLVITDRDMRPLNGEELAKRIRSTGRPVAIVMVSGRGADDPDIERWVADRLLDTAIGKPLTIVGITETIRKLHVRLFLNGPVADVLEGVPAEISL